MFIRTNESVIGTKHDVQWGSGRSLRLLTDSDQMGFTVCTTTVLAGTRSRLAYKNHLEACYCIGGSGYVESIIEGNVLRISPGTLYVLDQHDDHFLGADEDEDMILISIFNPPLKGTETHNIREGCSSHY